MKQFLVSAALLGITGLHAVAQDSTQPKIPLEGIETSWQNGNDRRDSIPFKTQYFTPILMMDLNYAHSFNSPNDNTVVGSTALARNNEVQLSQLSIGGEFNYGNARAKAL